MIFRKDNTVFHTIGNMQRTIGWIGLGLILTVNSAWGFFAHQRINRLAAFTLPPEMFVFYKKNIRYLTEAAVNPDRRRYTVADEAPRHYIDLDAWGNSLDSLPGRWEDAVLKYGEDSLQAHGIVVWHLQRMVYRLQEAFLLRDPKRILSVSAELGHYAADASVPLHTTSNYDGQKTAQNGIHAFWESRLPEMYFSTYDFFVGKAEYQTDVRAAIWKTVQGSHDAVDSVLMFEKKIFQQSGDRKFSFETKGKQTVKVIAVPYATEYHKRLAGMVERRLRVSIKLTGDLWYTAWVNAGQPDLKSLIDYQPSEEELDQRRLELKEWKEKRFRAREHEHEEPNEPEVP